MNDLRLKAISKIVSGGNTVCDVGTDHCHLPIYLIENNIFKKAIATDINIMPLKSAEKNIKEHNLEDKIKTRLGNGLMPLNKNEADTIIIAGMGGILISEILEQGKDIINENTSLVLQPMTNIATLKKYLFQNQFNIINEKLAKEGNKIYNIILAKKAIKTSYTDVDILIGRKLIENKDPLLKEYLKREIRKFEKKLDGMKKGHTKDGIKYIEEKLKILKEIQNETF